MPFLSAAENADLRLSIADPSIEGEQLVNVYRNPAASGAATSKPVLYSSNQQARIRPASGDPRMQRLVAQAGPIGAARVTHLGKMAYDADVLHGDEWRVDTTRYKVVGVGRWTNATLIALDEIKEQR